MATADSFLTNLFKKPAFTLAVVGLTGFGIGFLFEKNKEKAQAQSADKPSQKKSAKIQPEKHVEMPSKLEINKDELKAIMKEYERLLGESKRLESIVPRSFTSTDDLKNFCTKLEYSQIAHDFDSLTKGISEPIWDLLDRGGKRWRAIISMLIAQAYDRNIDEVVQVTNLVELIHNGLLIIEDIVYQNESRRNKPSIHQLYGHDISINAGCAMYFVPWFVLFRENEEKVPQEKITRLMKIYVQEMVNIHTGRAWDIYWRYSDKITNIPTEGQYFQMVSNKTGALARLSARFTCEMLDLPRDIQRRFSIFSEKISIAFEIQNDIARLREDVTNHHTFGQDISKSKMTLVLIHNLNNATFEDRTRLLDIMKSKKSDRHHMTEAISLLNKSDSINYARLKIDHLVKEAWDEIKDYVPNNIFKGYLKALAEVFAAGKMQE